jgi:ribosomal protein L27
MGTDDTLFAMANGFVKFTTRKIKRYTGAFKMVSFANVTPVEKK